MGSKFCTTEILSRFSTVDVLNHFGVKHHNGRCPCPICKTSPQSQSFSVWKESRWSCFACGARGDSIALYATLAGVRPGRAIAEIASHLGLIESSPETWNARAAERAAHAAMERAVAGVERRRLNKLASDAREAERLAATCRDMASHWGRTEIALGLIHEALALEEVVAAWDRHEARP